MKYKTEETVALFSISYTIMSAFVNSETRRTLFTKWLPAK